MNTIANFSQDAINQAVVEFVPACTQVSGKTTTDKRLSVIKVAEESVLLFAANLKGKVGTEARNGMFEQGFNKIAMQAARGNYKPLSQALALIMGENVYITSRASFESLEDRYQAMADQLEAAGKKYNKDGEKLTSKFAMYAQCLSLITGVYQAVEAVHAQKDANPDGILGHAAVQ